MMLTKRRHSAERDPEDPEYPRLKLVGVYPVRDGWAHVNLKEVAGKGQDNTSPLYVMQRGPMHNTSLSSVKFS